MVPLMIVTGGGLAFIEAGCTRTMARPGGSAVELVATEVVWLVELGLPVDDGAGTFGARLDDEPAAGLVVVAVGGAVGFAVVGPAGLGVDGDLVVIRGAREVDGFVVVVVVGALLEGEVGLVEGSWVVGAAEVALVGRAVVLPFRPGFGVDCKPGMDDESVLNAICGLADVVIFM